ncbi:hypothetical protein ACFY2Q_02265 [Micromonospora sp. NPDC000316]|uniref:hypothetical protein n=1 Tax=Micromonospora sp. NPDC000316 TaxID=3364216 RepID=UPI00369EA534
MSESAQQRQPDRNVDAGDPDVLLDISRAEVDSLRLAADGLDIDLSLRARLANLIELDAGVRVHLNGAELDVVGAHVEAQLRARLEQVVTLLGRALETIDNNPQVVDAIGRSVAVTIDDNNRGTEQMTTRAAEHTAPGQHSGVRDDPHRRSGTPGGVARPARSGSERPGTPDQGRAEATGPTGSRPGERPPTDRGPADRAREAQGSGRQDGGSGGAQAAAQSATQFAEQAGETLLQAGRSVWEAIQGGLSQHRPPDGRD